LSGGENRESSRVGPEVGAGGPESDGAAASDVTGGVGASNPDGWNIVGIELVIALAATEGIGVPGGADSGILAMFTGSLAHSVKLLGITPVMGGAVSVDG
jgi:hypothetical protein